MQWAWQIRYIKLCNFWFLEIYCFFGFITPFLDYFVWNLSSCKTENAAKLHIYVNNGQIELISIKSYLMITHSNITTQMQKINHIFAISHSFGIIAQKNNTQVHSHPVLCGTNNLIHSIYITQYFIIFYETERQWQLPPNIVGHQERWQLCLLSRNKELDFAANMFLLKHSRNVEIADIYVEIVL